MSKREEKAQKEKKDRLAHLPFIVMIGVVFLITIVVYAAMMMMPSTEIVSFHERHGLDSEQIHIIRQDTLITPPNPPIIISNEIYLPVDFIKDYIDRYIFWDADLSKLTITTDNKVIRMKTESLNYFVNSEPMPLQLPVYEENDIGFLPISFVEDFYDISFVYDDEHKRIILDYDTEDRQEGITVAKKVAVRYEPHKKSPLVTTLDVDQLLTLYRETDDYTKVRTSDGTIGYVLTKHIQETQKIEAKPIPITESHTTIGIEGKLNMAWETTKALHSFLPQGLDVISPVWFSFENTDGDIKVEGLDPKYIELAKENGYQVWPAITDNFDPQLCYEILSNTDKREHIIKQLLAYVAMYNLDGINIDFEAVRQDNAENFLQFMRELSPYMKEQGVVLSVDMFVPLYTRYYNRTELAKTVDYMMIMAYDEHHNSSPVSGPVASIGFVEAGIVATLEEVPSHKVVLGLPYYVRIWREEQGEELYVSTRNVGMNFARKIFSDAGATFEWQEDLACYYAEYTVIENGNTVTYRTWLEDLRSIEEKLKLINKYDLAGVAGWQKGLEDYEVWPLLEQYLKP